MNILIFFFSAPWPIVVGRMILAVGVLLSLISGASLFLYWKIASYDEGDEAPGMDRRWKACLLVGLFVGLLVAAIGIAVFVCHDGAIATTL